MKAKSFFLLLVVVIIVSCGGTSEQPLTGDDQVDITANKWLNQVNMHDHFICFEEDGTGWEADIEDNTVQLHSFFSKKSFKYDIDTKKKCIAVTYNKDEKEEIWEYNLKNDGSKMLELNGTPFIDGTKEISQFDSRFLETISDAADGIFQLFQMFQNQ